MRLGWPHTELRRTLVAAVLSGEVGSRFALHDYADEPIAVVETTEVRILRLADADVALALDEGEGFSSVAEWRSAHETFWSEHDIEDDTLIVVERFRVIQRL